jgi:hypothetical protein
MDGDKNKAAIVLDCEKQREKVSARFICGQMARCGCNCIC